MDVITQAIVFAFSKFGDEVIKDAYQSLKSLIIAKYGPQSDIVSSIKSIESMPNSENRRMVLQETVAASGADQDHELLKAAIRILRKVNEYEINISQKAVGKGNVLSHGDSNSGKFNSNRANRDVIMAEGDITKAETIYVNKRKETSLLGCSGKVIIWVLYIVVGLYGLSSLIYIIGTQDVSEGFGLLISIGLIFALNQIYKKL